MKWPLLFLFLLTGLHHLSAQKLQTITPGSPVVIGTAFQVQYVLTDLPPASTVQPPSFEGFTVVSGPHSYKGTTTVDGRPRSIENITYTLVPNRVGTLPVGGISLRLRNGSEERSADASVQVIDKQAASYQSRSSYTDVNLYAPGEKSDVEQLIRENLFVRAVASRTSCFVGEPIVVSFTLYSRLQSNSEVINFPSLYGFSAIDMINTAQAHHSVETINGQVFNTALLRKIQLFPDQSGTLVIDPLQLRNEIEFGDGQKQVLVRNIASQPLSITVKPLPRPAPEDFAGAVGQYRLAARLVNEHITASGGGKLLVRISGTGNMGQWTAPPVEWPAGFDVFEPEVKDSLNKTSSPLSGTRELTYVFTTNKRGRYRLAPVAFTFFDPRTASYITLRSDSFELLVQAPSAARPGVAAAKKIVTGNWLWVWIAAAAALVTALIVLTRKKKVAPPPAPAGTTDWTYADRVTAIDTRSRTVKETCDEIQRVVKNYLKEKDVPRERREALQVLLQDCQLLIYSNTDAEIEKEELKKRAEDLLREN